MLKSIDILIGLGVVMLMMSLVVTVFTEAVSHLLLTRGRNLLDGIAGLLRQMHSDIPEQASREIATGILTHPMITAQGSGIGAVIHREELTSLILELAAGEGPNQLEGSLRAWLCHLLQANGISEPAKTMANVREAALLLERAHPELSNNERYAAAFMDEAFSPFLAKLNGWFDQTIDRVAERFTNSTRIITFAGSLLVTLVLQLDAITLVNRLSTDPALRESLVTQAVQLDQRNVLAPRNAASQAATTQPPPTAGANDPTSPAAPFIPPGAPVLIPSLNEADRENLRMLASFDLIEIPTSLDAWLEAWKKGQWELRLAGMLLTAMLLSLGAPFWYNALKNLIRLRSVISQKDDDQRLTRQTNAGETSSDGPTTAFTAAKPTLLAGERGDLGSMG